MSLPTAIAIIPARGGSVGINGKNIRCFCGRPLLAWTIEVALAARHVAGVYVSTDDARIAGVAREWGALVIDRPPELATDEATSESALLHALNSLEAGGQSLPDVMVFLQCTAPLTTPNDVDDTVRLVAEEGYDSAFAAYRFHGKVWQRNLDEACRPVNHPPGERARRQDSPTQLLEAGSVYAMRLNGFRRAGYRFFGRIGACELSGPCPPEIDEPADWPVAEMFKRHQLRASSSPAWQNVRIVVTDFDGVLTDNRLHVDQDGKESVVCNRGDGWGVNMLAEAGVPVLCVSTERNSVVACRCAKMRIECHHGVADKVRRVNRCLAARGLTWAQCAYIGNDTNDLGCLQRAGLGVVPSDAAPEARRVAGCVATRRGGEGVLREVASRILNARKAGAPHELVHTDR